MLAPVPSDRNLPASLSGSRADEASLRSLICHVGRLMHQARYIDAVSGNISARLDDERILITPARLSLGFLQPDQLIVIDSTGQRADAATDPNRSIQSSDEAALHLECYRQRADVMGVIHAHPATATALTIAGISLRTCVVPETIIVLGLIPTAAYSTPLSQENLDAVRALISQHDASLMAYYGSLTVGPDVWQAYLKLEMLEHTATIVHRTAQVGSLAPLPPAQVARLLEIRRQLGYWRPGDEERFCEACGVCE